MRVVFDTETNGLLDEVHTIHSLVIEDLDSDRRWSFHDNTTCDHERINTGLAMLAEADEAWAHNAIGFDAPALKIVYPNFSFKPGALRDSLVGIKIRWAHIREKDFELKAKGRLPANMIGRHSLEAWGHRLGLHKGAYDGGWENWSPEMQAYCEQDVAVLKRIVQVIYKDGFSQQAYDIEHAVNEYLFHQEHGGFPFDLEKAVALQAKLAARREEIDVELRKAFGSWTVDLPPLVPKRDNKKKGWVAGVPVPRSKVVEFNPASRAHIANRLQKLYNWKPTKYTDKGAIQVDETILAGMDFPECPLLVERFLLEKRLGSLVEGKQAWMSCAKPNKITKMVHVHGRVNSEGAVTHRMSHSHPNMAQVPAATSKFGAECRSLWTVPKGWRLVGSDSAALELRCLAHYLAKYDDGAYAKTVVEGTQELGTDIHSVNRDALGLEGKEGRNKAKTFIYAFLYGAGDAKIGSIFEPTAGIERQKKVGKHFKAQFLRGLPALDYLLKAVSAQAKKHGYLLLPDGRRVYIRSEHAALNSLLQGAGAIICKQAMVVINSTLVQEYGLPGWDRQWTQCATVHDELQIACRELIAQPVADICVTGWRAPTEIFNWRCPLDGAATIGANWYSTH